MFWSVKRKQKNKPVTAIRTRTRLIYSSASACDSDNCVFIGSNDNNNRYLSEITPLDARTVINGGLDVHSNWNLEVLGGKTGEPGEKPSKQGEN